MRQRLILHIGTHKTGSTTIQNYLYYNRLWLRFAGVYYPKPINGPLFYTNNHSDLRDTARSEGKPRGPSLHPQFGAHDALLGQYVRSIKEKGNHTNILSCEGWSSNLNRYARRLAPLSQHFDVTVIAFIRRPDYWIERFYAQRIANIQHRETRSFEDFIAQPHIDTYLYNRTRLFGWWAKAFGAAAVQVIPFEPAAPGFDLINRFLENAQIKSSFTNNLLLRNARTNTALSKESVEAIRALHAQPDPANKSDVQRIKKSKGKPAVFLTLEERAKIIAKAEPDMQQICTRFVHDGREKLFDDNPE